MTNNTISLRSLLEKEKLNGTNFLDWFRNLRIVLKQEWKEFVIEEPVLMNQQLMHLELTKTTYSRHSWCRMSYACHHESWALEATRGFGRKWYDQKRFMKGKHVRRGMRPPKLYFNAWWLKDLQWELTSSMMGYIKALVKLSFSLKGWIGNRSYPAIVVE